jgi:DNA-binding LytR/AlgR family response regulator
MKTKKHALPKKAKEELDKKVLAEVTPVENNHCTLLEFEEGTIVLEIVAKAILLVLQFRDIMWVSVRGNYCSIKLRGVSEMIVFRITLTELRALLPANYFWLVHESYIVGRKHILKFIPDNDGGAQLILYDGTVVDVSPEHRECVRKTLKENGLFLPVKDVKLVPNRQKKDKSVKK